MPARNDPPAKPTNPPKPTQQPSAAPAADGERPGTGTPAASGTPGTGAPGRGTGGGPATGAPGPGAEKSAKSEQTRTLILETALRLFQERGYDKTTMRAIAKEAGVSVGNAYYYFDGKEHLIQGFYDRISVEHARAVRPILARETDFEARLAGVLTAWVDISEPYHEFAAQFFKNAADPESPLSPFSPESEGARDAAIDVHREVLAGSKAKLPDDLAAIVPELMWLAQMGLVLYWVFDRSEKHERSRKLAQRGARLTARGVSLARFRVLRPLVREVYELFADFRPQAEHKARPEPGEPAPDQPEPGKVERDKSEPGTPERTEPERADGTEPDRKSRAGSGTDDGAGIR